MRVISGVQRVIMYLLLIPLVAIGLDTLLRAFDAQEGNPIVDGVRRAADTAILEPFRTVFPDQSYLQTALVALAAYGVLTLLVVALFRGLRSLVGSRPPAPPRSAQPVQKRRETAAAPDAPARPDEGEGDDAQPTAT